MNIKRPREKYGIDITKLKDSFPNFKFSKDITERMHKIATKYTPVIVKVDVWDFCNNIYNGNFQEVYESAVFEALDKLCNSNSENLLCQGVDVYRARIISNGDLLACQNGISYTDEGFSGYNYLNSKEPPIGYSNSGRANPRYSSYFYCASNIETAACEVKPYVGDYISVARFKIAKELKLISFVDIPDDTDDFSQNNYLNFMRFCFSRPIKNEKDYIITQFLSDEIRKYGYDGLCFKSIFTDDINYVIFNCSMSNIIFEQSKIIKMCAQESMFIDYNGESTIVAGKFSPLSDENIINDKISLLKKIEKMKKLQEIRESENLVK